MRSQKTGTLLDTSSDEDSEGPMAITDDFVKNLQQKTEPDAEQQQPAMKHKPSMIPRTMALQKGKLDVNDLLEDVK